MLHTLRQENATPLFARIISETIPEGIHPWMMDGLNKAKGYSRRLLIELEKYPRVEPEPVDLGPP
jgi:hypothetical protein